VVSQLPSIMRALTFILLPAFVTEGILAYGISTWKEPGEFPPNSLAILGAISHLPSCCLIGTIYMPNRWWMVALLQSGIWAGIYSLFYAMFFKRKLHETA
jgi:hypothetical protein